MITASGLQNALKKQGDKTTSTSVFVLESEKDLSTVYAVFDWDEYVEYGGSCLYRLAKDPSGTWKRGRTLGFKEKNFNTEFQSGMAVNGHRITDEAFCGELVF